MVPGDPARSYLMVKLEGKQAASLAGLAPISQQSGKWRGKERINGGRAFLRRAIYMPALVASRSEPACQR